MNETNSTSTVQQNEKINSVYATAFKLLFTRYGIITFTVIVAIVILFFLGYERVALAICALEASFCMYYINVVRHTFMQQFAQSIGFTYAPSTSLSTVSGYLFNVGDKQFLQDVLEGTYTPKTASLSAQSIGARPIPMRIYTLRFEVQNGKNHQTRYYTICESTLQSTVPDMLLYSLNSFGFGEGQVSDWFSGDETIALEGDFTKYFRLRAPRGKEQEVYEIFTPDVMAHLIDTAQGLNFELAGNKLYIYMTHAISKASDMQTMFDRSTYLIGLFEKNTARL